MDNCKQEIKEGPNYRLVLEKLRLLLGLPVGTKEEEIIELAILILRLYAKPESNS
jgi:hypothetical protein